MLNVTYKLTNLNNPEQDIEFVKIEIVNINTFFSDGMELKAHLQLLVAKQRSFQRVKSRSCTDNSETTKLGWNGKLIFNSSWQNKEAFRE